MTETTYCPGCGAANVTVGLDSVLIQTSPVVRRHVCGMGRVTIVDPIMAGETWS